MVKVDWSQLNAQQNPKNTPTLASVDPWSGGKVADPLQVAIAGAESAIKTLEKQIAKTEASNVEKREQINTLVNQIATRRDQLERERGNQQFLGLGGLLLGYPAVGLLSLLEMEKTDQQLIKLNASLVDAQSQQATANWALRQYRSTKATLTASLDGLRSLESGLRVKDASTPLEVEDNVRAFLEASTDFERSSALLDNLGQQIGLLQKLQKSGKEVERVLTPIVAQLTQSAAAATAAVEAAQKATLGLLRVLLSPTLSWRP